ARIGGDEYVVGLPGASAEAALIMLEEIRVHVAGADHGIDWTQKLSAGIASRPPHAESVDDLLKFTDQALMRAKREGGNRISIWIEEKMTLKSNYYTPAQLDRLSKLSGATGRTEASLLREALDALLNAHRDEL
ncbi:MAG: diguanylate cyclase, partial [Acidimicrobiales bacterium]